MTVLKRVLARLGLALLRVFALFVLLVLAYPLLRLWDDGRVKAFCAAVPAGLPLAKLPELAREHGVNSPSNAKRLQHPEASEHRVIYVASTWSVGQTTCTIRHDGAAVVSARMDHW